MKWAYGISVPVPPNSPRYRFPWREGGGRKSDPANQSMGITSMVVVEGQEADGFGIVVSDVVAPALALNSVRAVVDPRGNPSRRNSK